MRRLGLPQLAEVEHRPAGPDGSRLLGALAAWFSTPFVMLPGPTTAVLAAARTRTGRPDREVDAVAPTPLAARIRDLAGTEAVGGPPTTLVDRHLEGRFGELRPDDVRGVAAAVRHGSPTDLLLRFDDGTEATAAPADLLAALVTQVIVGHHPAAVADGLPALLARFRPGPGPARRTTVAALLPLPAGRRERAAVHDVDAVAVSAGAYPAIGALLPEVAGVTSPIAHEGRADFLVAGPVTGSLVPAGPLDRLALRVAPVRRAPVAGAVHHGRRSAARLLRAAKRAAGAPAPSAALGLVGFDPDTRRGIVTRLDPPVAANPWLDPAEWTFLGAAHGRAEFSLEPRR